MNGMKISEHVEKGWRGKTMPKHLWNEVDWKIGLQKEWIESEPDWEGKELDYELAFNDVW